MEDGLYLEDLHLGQVFVSGSATMEADAMIAFATEFDPQPFHLDEHAARASLFGGLAASGWYAVARSRPNRGMVLLLSRTFNQRDKVVQTMASTIVVPRRPGDEGPAGEGSTR
ncbi:MAG TPA: MaoC/PaaZ C-terminal domain-containing protein [Stellaceae bacterium]|jgi:acyl dehydratase|nr:MaoC/PaaZ C-terminal domain-containing protein [Stellaceae bacterium]